MKSALIAAVALAVACLSPARADTIMFSVPLFDSSSTSSTPDGRFSGTLTYDLNAGYVPASGTFTLADTVNPVGDFTNLAFSGTAAAMMNGNGLGIAFMGDASDVPFLSFSLNLALGSGVLHSNGLGSVTEQTTGLTYFYSTIAEPNTGTGPGTGGTGPGTGGGNPGTSVPGVPLPASAPLFGGALLLMAFAGLGRRLRRVAAAGGRAG